MRPTVQAAELQRAGGAMNSGPIGSLTVVFRIRSISALAGASSHHPVTSSTGCNWPGWRAPHNAVVMPWSSIQRIAKMDDALAKPLLREPIEPLHGSKILREARLLEFWIAAAQIVAL